MRTWINSHKHFLIICLSYILLPIIAFWRNFDLSGINTTFFGGEFVGGYYPEFFLGMDLFGKFKDMLWDPYNLLGIPHMGAVDRLGFFYPVKFTFYFLGSITPASLRLFLISYFSIFHISLAGIFMYIFTKRVLKLSLFVSFIVGVIFAFNGSNVRFVAFPNHILSISYLPLMLFFLYEAVKERSILKCLFAGIAFSPSLLSGYTPFFLYNNLFVVLFLLLTSRGSRREILRVVLYLIIANLFAFGLSAPALLPNLENASMSERIPYNLIGSSANPYNPLMFVHYIFPGFFSSSAGTSGIILGYVGITSLILAFLSFFGVKNKYLFVFTLLAFFFFILSLGNFTFLHQIVYLVVPKYKYFRFPGSMHYIVAFCIACVAGYGLESINKRRKILNSNTVKISVILVSTTLISLLLMSYVLKNSTYRTDLMQAAIPAILVTTVFFFLSLVVIYAINLYPKVGIYKFILFLVVCLQLFNVVSMPGSANSNLDPRKVNGKNNLIDWLRENTKSDYSRVYLPDSNIRYNSASSKLYQINGYFSMTPKNLSLLFDPTADSSMGVYRFDSKVLDIAGVKYIVSKENLDLSLYPKLKKIKEFVVEKLEYGQFMDWRGEMLPVGTLINIYENIDYFPKISFFTKYKVVFNDEQAANLIQEFNGKDTVILTLNSSDKNVDLIGEENAVNESTFNIKKYSNTEVVIDTTTRVPEVLVLNDLYYPSWKAEIDGKAVKIMKANVAFRGIHLPSGNHIVRFYYYPQKLYIGLCISVSCVIFFVAMLILSFRRKNYES